MELKIAICDDDCEPREQIKNYINQIILTANIDPIFFEFSSGEELLEAYSSPNTFHILILDIEMSGIDGIAVARKIRALPDRRVRILFLTNFPQYWKPGYSVQPYEFLLKPLNKTEFKTVFSSMSDDILADQADRDYSIQFGSQLIPLDDIYYFCIARGKRGVLEAHLADQFLTHADNLNTWEQRLFDHGFVTCYRGYLVNLKYVLTFNDHELVLANQERLPLSRTYEKQLRERFADKIFCLCERKHPN